MRRPLLLLLSLLALPLSGCTPTFDPITLVDKLRLLAVIADTPALGGGESTTLTAVTWTPDGSAPHISWAACLTPPPPATGSGINQDCYYDDRGAVLQPLGEGAAVTVTMPAISDPLAFGLPDETNGIYLPVRLVLTAGDERLVAFRRIRYFAGPPLDPNARNNNPRVTEVTAVPDKDAPMDQETPVSDRREDNAVHAGDELHLRARAADEEPYVIYDGNPLTTPPRPVNEILRIGWYATAGKLEETITGNDKPDNKWTFDKHVPAAGTDIELWIVVQDDRGGAGYVQKHFVMR
jgi:hypothetical protein